MIAPKAALADIYRYPMPLENRDGLLRLDKNENLVGLPQTAIAEILGNVDGAFLSAYPDYGGILAKLADFLQLPEDHLLLTNGSDSASRLIFETFVDQGEEVVFSFPTFAMHPVYAEIAGARIVKVCYSEDWTFPFNELLERISPTTRLAVVVTPNNPTGHCFSHQQLRVLARKCEETGTLLFVDEAYIEFAGESFCQAVMEFENLVLTRTFSKAMGLASVRLGYAMGNPAIIRCLRLTQPIYDVNKFAVLFGSYVLDHPELVDDYVAAVQAGREYVIGAVRNMGLSYHAASGNFVLIKVDGDAEQVVTALRQRLVVVSCGFKLPNATGWIRATLGPPAEMKRFIDALSEVLAQ